MSTAEHRFLLDTHTFIWAATGDRRLGNVATRLILNLDNELLLSTASIWEMAIKSSLGKLGLEIPLANLVDSQLQHLGATLLDVKKEHALAVEQLPFHHRDPFDRLLIAQAIHEQLTLISRDPNFDHYPVSRRW